MAARHQCTAQLAPHKSAVTALAADRALDRLWTGSDRGTIRATTDRRLTLPLDSSSGAVGRLRVPSGEWMCMLMCSRLLNTPCHRSGQGSGRRQSGWPSLSSVRPRARHAPSSDRLASVRRSSACLRLPSTACAFVRSRVNQLDPTCWPAPVRRCHACCAPSCCHSLTAGVLAAAGEPTCALPSGRAQHYLGRRAQWAARLRPCKAG